MKELYKLIEQKIKASGYPGHISGADFFADISAEMEDKDPGFYLFMIKKSDSLEYVGHADLYPDQFDLHTVDIHEEGKVWHVDFDA